jgi:hypothetical protein
MFKLKRELKPMQPIPRFYGLGYLEPFRDVAVCYPIPLNFIMRGVTNAYMYTLHAARPNKFEGKLASAYFKGWGDANINVEERISKAVKNAEIDIGKRMLENLTRMSREIPQDKM